MSQSNIENMTRAAVPGTTKLYEHPSQIMVRHRKEDPLDFRPSMSVFIPLPIILA
jgi:hypothetical protein